ncbi:MAG TPA: hypothetical protein VFB15_11625 [Candidatus Binataceae bacterium]|nr:hypothetical protein [Candidatus Binataceae bacterium]
MDDRTPRLRLLLRQDQITPENRVLNEDVAASCERDLAESLFLAQQFNRLRRIGRIGPGVTYADFLTISAIGRGWAIAGDADVVREEVRESDGTK